MDVSWSSRCHSTQIGANFGVFLGILLPLGPFVVMDTAGNEQTLLATARLPARLNPLCDCSAELLCAMLRVERPISGVTLGHFSGDKPTIAQSSSGSGKCKQTQYNITKDGKAAGKDGLPVELIKYAAKEFRWEVYQLILEIWRRECFPQSCKESVLYPIFKKGNRKQVEMIEE